MTGDGRLSGKRSLRLRHNQERGGRDGERSGESRYFYVVLLIFLY